MKCFQQIKNKNKKKNKNAQEQQQHKYYSSENQTYGHYNNLCFFFLILCSVPLPSPSFLRTHTYNLPFGILSYYTIFFFYLLSFFLFVVNFYEKKIKIFLSSLDFVLCLLCVGFLVFLVFILLHTSSYSFFFGRIFFFWDCVVVVVGGSKICTYILYKFLAASPDNLLLAFFVLFLYTIF